LVERVQEPPQANLINSILEPANQVACTEPSPVETLQLSLSLARVAVQSKSPSPGGGSSGERLLPSTPNIASQLSVPHLQTND
jgi:hypothetical protein